MSYEKAMRHVRNRRKGRNLYLGFDTGMHFKAARASPYLEALLNVREWFPQRHHGSHDRKQHTRECIREAIKEARLQEEFLRMASK